MKQMLTVATTAVVLNSATAGITGDATCQSACGLFATADQCKTVVAQGGFCKSMQKKDDGKVRFHPGYIADADKLSVAEALTLVEAPENNCFAMYYEDATLRQHATYCAENNVCPKLFWDAVTEGERTFKYAAESGPAYNALSPVLCDYAASEKAPIEEDVKGEVDPCKTLCAMSHSKQECALVQRQNQVCHRLFWTDAAKTKTDFSVRTPRGTQIPVPVAEARAMLATKDCEDLCARNSECSKRGEGAHCGDNKVCHGLFFVPSANLAQMAVCFEGQTGCNNLDTHVHCGVSSATSSTNINPNGTPIKADPLARNANGVYSGLAVATVVLLVSLL